MKRLATVMTVLLSLVIAACTTQGTEPAAVENATPESAAEPASQDMILNIVWQWSDLTETEPAGQSIIPDPERYTVTFLPEGTANIQADCNRISWPYTMEGNSIRFDALFATTLAACPPDSLDQQFLQNLEKSETAELSSGRLILNLADNSGSMGFGNGGAAGSDHSGSGSTEPMITITSPEPGATLDGPYIAEGTGQGLPEGNVVVRLLDGNNELMAEQATVLQGENVGTGGFGSWRVQFDNIYGQPNSNGAIEAFNPDVGVSSSISIWFSGQ